MEILIGLIAGIVWFIKGHKENPYEKGDWETIKNELLDKE